VANYAGSQNSLSADSLVVITWNTYVGGGDVIAFVQDLRSGVHTGGLPQRHFVLLIQEAHRAGSDFLMVAGDVKHAPRAEPTPPSGDRIDIMESARTLGLWLFYVPSMRNGAAGEGSGGEDKGNAILSTVALRELTAIELPFEKYRRVATAATLDGASSAGAPWQLRICNVHLDGRARFPRYLQSAGAGRLRQARALLPWLPEVPAVLGGDLNTWAPGFLETVVPFIREKFPQPVELDDQTTVVARFVPDRRVDYILFNLPRGLTGRYEKVHNRYGSDHHPLLGWVQLAPDVNNDE
jgi:endonuclease/exonuclease/phosphatase family metal-dependent hydrolase